MRRSSRNGEHSPAKTIQSVERFLDILFAFTERHPRWRLGDLSLHLRLHPSTVSRLLGTAKRSGMIEHDEKTGEYRLGLRILHLSSIVMSDLDLVRISLPFLSSLASDCNEDTFLAVLDNLKSVTVSHVASPRVLSMRPYVGLHLEPNATSGGKLLLAYGPEAQVEKLISNGLKKLTDKTITDATKFREELTQIRERGFSISDEEMEEGLIAIAAPVQDATDRVVAAVSVSGSNRRMNPDRLGEIIPLVVKTGEQISLAMGGTASANGSRPSLFPALLRAISSTYTS